MATVNLKCIVCNRQLHTNEESRNFYDQNIQNLGNLLEKMFGCLTKFFDLRSATGWDYILKYYSQAREIPFCENPCRSLIAQLVILQQHLEPIEQKIFRIKSKISTTIIEIVETTTTSTSSCDPVILNVSGNVQFNVQQQDSPPIIKIGSNTQENFDSEILESQIKRFRQNIVERLKPKVVLINCDNNSNISREDQRKLSPSQLPLHDDDGGNDDRSKIKLEPPPSPLMEAVECNQDDLENMNLDDFEPHHHHQRHHPQIRPTNWQTYSQLGMEEFVTTVPIWKTDQQQQQQGVVKMEYEEHQHEEFLRRMPMGEEPNNSEDENVLFDDKLDPLYVPPGYSSGMRRSKRRTMRQNLPPQMNLDVITESSSSPRKVSRKGRGTSNNFPCPFCRISCSTGSGVFRHMTNIHRKSLAEARRIRAKLVAERAELRRKLCKGNLKLQKATKPPTWNRPKPLKLQTSSTKISQPEPGSGETQHSYKNWNYKKTLNGACICCTCGSRRGTEGTMIAHLKVRHILNGVDRRIGSRSSKDCYAVNQGDGKFLMYDKWEFICIGDGQFQCSACLHTTSRKLIAEHIKRIHCPEKCRFVCHRCNLGFVSRSNLAKHERQHARQRWWQTGCGSYTYDGRFEFDLVDNSYQCGTCGVVMASTYVMARHIRDVHAEPHNCACLNCGIQFTSKGCLRKHLLRTCESIRWKQLNDDKLLYDKKWFVETYTVNEGDSEVIRYRCCSCGQSRSHKPAMRAHINEFHINPGRFVCSTCGCAFNKAYNLKVHQSVHTTSRPYVCSFPNKNNQEGMCGRHFKTKRQLVIHKNKSHPKEQPFVLTTTATRTTPSTATTSQVFIENDNIENVDDDDDVIIISD